MNIVKCWSIRHVLGLVELLLAAYGVLFTLFYWTYVRPDYKHLLYLTQCETEADVRGHFGRDPEIVYEHGETMPELGWKLPARNVSCKVLVYTNHSALRFYVYVDAEGRVEYVYTSNS